MTSKSIYTHNPYFYIIQHIPSGRFYAGAKWGKGADPESFMSRGGYSTSSNIINGLVESGGLESFKTILILREPECFMSVNDYETIFLQSNNIANNENWLNKHNNDGHFNISYGTNEFYESMLNKYGVDNPMGLESTKIKMKSTWIENYGVDHPMKSKIVVDKLKRLMLEKYGVDHYSKTEECKISVRTTNLENMA